MTATSDARRTTSEAEHLELKRALNPWQILLLALSGIIGVTLFSTTGEVLATAAVGSLMLALALVSATAIAVMECVSEFIVLWPVPNALVEYVKRFVDEDLSIVVGIAYWYTWSSIFVTLLVAASQFLCDFLTANLYRVIILVVVGLALVGINIAGVKTYGRIEAVGGIVKWLNAIAGGIFLWVAVGKSGSKNDNAAFKYQKSDANNSFTAFCMCIPILAYGFIGVEIVAVTAFEAERRESLRQPSRWIAWVMACTYLFVTLPGAIVVGWQDPLLQHLHPQTPSSHPVGGKRDIAPNPPQQCHQYYPLIVLAAYEYGSKGAAKYFNACIIYFCISASNTSLYVASRTLYGLMREEVPFIAHELPFKQRMLQLPRLLGRLSAHSRVPAWAVVASAASFAWLPALRADSDISSTEMLQVMSTIGSVGGVLVWAAQCLAYIKYYAWLRKWKPQLGAHYDRWRTPTYQWQRQRPLLSSFQPAVAWFGLIMCLLIVFVLGSSFWWNGKATAADVASAYAGPAFLLGLFLLLKLRRRFNGKEPSTTRDPVKIARDLENLSQLRLTDEPLAEDESTIGHVLTTITTGSLFRSRS